MRDRFVVALTLLAASICGAQAQQAYGAPPPRLQEHLDRLARAYPDWIGGYDDAFVRMKDDKKFPISDRLSNKTFQQLLEHPDIDDMFFTAYPAGVAPRQPAKNSDPGRVRFEPLFAAMYGDCNANQVTRKLRTISWLPKHQGGRVTITTVNGVDRALEAVSRELDQLPGDFLKFLKPAAGTYNCRLIAGSTARSMHAYAAAIDINSRFASYWRWSTRTGSEPRWENKIPIEIVRVFEKHGFIWGGYWYHYDTMHFEYRPELLPSLKP